MLAGAVLSVRCGWKHPFGVQCAPSDPEYEPSHRQATQSNPTRTMIMNPLVGRLHPNTRYSFCVAASNAYRADFGRCSEWAYTHTPTGVPSKMNIPTVGDPSLKHLSWLGLELGLGWDSGLGLWNKQHEMSLYLRQAHITSLGVRHAQTLGHPNPRS